MKPLFGALPASNNLRVELTKSCVQLFDRVQVATSLSSFASENTYTFIHLQDFLPAILNISAEDTVWVCMIATITKLQSLITVYVEGNALI